MTSKGSRKCDEDVTNINKICHFKTRLVTLASLDVDFCVAEKDIWGVSYDFVERSCRFLILKEDEGCYDDTADVLPVYSWSPYVSRQGQKHTGQFSMRLSPTLTLIASRDLEEGKAWAES